MFFMSILPEPQWKQQAFKPFIDMIILRPIWTVGLTRSIAVGVGLECLVMFIEELDG